MRPSSGISSPASRRSNVLLPQPEGPSSAKNSPSKMSSDTRSSAATSEKRLLTPSNRTSGRAAGSVHGAKFRRTRGLESLFVSVPTFPMPSHARARMAIGSSVGHPFGGDDDHGPANGIGEPAARLRSIIIAEAHDGTRLYEESNQPGEQ